jgi:hypothetical protein
LGDLQFWPHDDATAFGFRFGGFLNCNPSIEELLLNNLKATSIGIDIDIHIPAGHAVGDANSGRVGTGCLPNLKIFRGSVAAFAQLATKGAAMSSNDACKARAIP